MSDETLDPAIEEQADPTAEARDALATIRKGWRHVLNPIRVSGGGSTQSAVRAATEDELDNMQPLDARADTPRILAFWVHAALDEWPAILQTLQPGPDGKLRLVTTETIDCSNVPAMVALLTREVERVATWVEPGHNFGATFVGDMRDLARAVERVAWPPKGDRMVIGDCPSCGRRVRVKAPKWRKRPVRVPQPSTDPTQYAEWTWWVPDGAEWEPDRDRPIACKCGREGTFEEWREALAGPSLLLTADEIVVDVREQLGMRYQPAVLRQWARRGMIATKGYSHQGHALYDRTQVFAALIAREADRERAS